MLTLLFFRQPELQAQFESIFKELGAISTETADNAVKNIPTPGAAPGATTGEASFQETIKRTMERMQASGDQATAAAAAEGSDDFLAELLKQMQTGGLEGAGSEEELSKMLLGVMEQLTNKEILYEPMKELNEKFPGWLEKNRDKTSEDDLKRYEAQQKLVKEIVDKFEEPTYSDGNAVDREYIVGRMQKVCNTSLCIGSTSMIQLLTLVTYRCKLRGLRRPILSRICHRLKMCSICQTNHVILNSGRYTRANSTFHEKQPVPIQMQTVQLPRAENPQYLVPPPT